MTTVQKHIVKHTWQLVAKLDDKAVGTLFYDRLFYIAPEVRTLFLSPVPEQSKKLVAMLNYMVRHIDQPDEISTTVAALAKRHAGYKVKAYQYAIVGNALLWTLEQGLGDVWNEDVEEAWATFYTGVAECMTGAYPSPGVAA